MKRAVVTVDPNWLAIFASQCHRTTQRQAAIERGDEPVPMFPNPDQEAAWKALCARWTPQQHDQLEQVVAPAFMHTPPWDVETLLDHPAWPRRPYTAMDATMYRAIESTRGKGSAEAWMASLRPHRDTTGQPVTVVDRGALEFLR